MTDTFLCHPVQCIMSAWDGYIKLVTGTSLHYFLNQIFRCSFSTTVSKKELELDCESLHFEGTVDVVDSEVDTTNGDTRITGLDCDEAEESFNKDVLECVDDVVATGEVIGANDEVVLAVVRI